MDKEERKILEELLQAVKERPDDIKIGVRKLDDITDMDIDTVMQDISFPAILNHTGIMIMHTMTLWATGETMKYTDLQERRFDEFSLEVSKLFTKYTLNYAEILCFISNIFDHILQHNPKSNPGIYRRTE